ERATLRARFNQCHYVLLERFLSGDLLERTCDDLKGAAGENVIYPDVGQEILMKADLAARLLEYLLNGDALFRTVEDLTGCTTIKSFRGRVYQMQSKSPHHFGWHSDLSDDRLVAISINLSAEPFEGGVLEIAEATSHRVLQRVTNVQLGDAVLFRISES